MLLGNVNCVEKQYLTLKLKMSQLSAIFCHGIREALCRKRLKQTQCSLVLSTILVPRVCVPVYTCAYSKTASAGEQGDVCPNRLCSCLTLTTQAGCSM